ncbi:hypothetical protein [Mitsuaria sp. GD03876]|uniref:hypothetical protein n=1 Tax=Mitsuaria sp. GD03876 TaxID=2975399 RepID=UPI002446945E|nr:hypothetical protein [Mitsuaria sp. GD03876]MDH0866716.1 hypothetical protein [Mitsuaria sp. GD03876]
MRPPDTTRPRRLPRATLASLAAAVLVGCAGPAAREAARRHQDLVDRAAELQARLRDASASPSLVLADPVPRFATRSVPLRQEERLPAHLGDIRLHAPGRLSLAAAAELISRAIDLPVVMSPDALHDAADYAPGLLPRPAFDAAAARPEESDAMRQAALAGARRLDVSAAEHRNTVEIDHAGPLRGLLDRIAAQAGLQWIHAGGRIVFSRVVTRAIPVKALPGGLRTSAAFDVLGGTDGGAGSAKVDVAAQSDYWAGLPEVLRPMLSPMAALQVDPRAGLVTVTDARANVERVQAHLEALNANLLRQVVLEVEVLQVSFFDEYNHGIDWNAVLGRLDQGNRLRLTGPSALGPMSGGPPAALSFLLGASSSRGSASEWIAKALQEYGRVSTAYSSVVTTTNRMPVPLGALQTRAYVQRTTAATQNAATGVTIPGAIEPGKLSTGLGLTVLPVILDSNLVLLQTALQVSELQQLRAFTSGQGDAAQSVQLPETTSFSAMQRIRVPAGRTLVLAGFEREHAQLDDADVVRGVLPLARRGTRGKQGTVVLITPRLVEP